MKDAYSYVNVCMMVFERVPFCIVLASVSNLGVVFFFGQFRFDMNELLVQ